MANYSRILRAAFLVTTTALGSVLAAHSNALAQSSDPGPPPTNTTDGTEELKTADTATASSAAPTDGASELKPITVTGTHIRGARAAGAQLEIYTREDLDRSGYATVQDFIHTLPQNFQGGGGSEDASTGTLGTSNHFSGSSINLRGLGADSTLVLLNGRRMPNAGLEGNFIDISLLPQAAIERIEILPDGASALYGSDAIGGVVNFIMRKDYSGAETRLRYGRATESNTDEYRLSQAFGGTWSSGHAFISYEFYRRDFLTYGDRDYARSLDLRSQGGADYRYTLSSPGNILDLATFQPAYAIPSGQDGRNLTVDDLLPNQTNYQDRNPRGSLLPKQNRHSLFASAEQSITDNFTIFADALYSERRAIARMRGLSTYATVPATNPFNPFRTDPANTGDVWVAYSFEPEFGPEKSHSKIKNGIGNVGGRLSVHDWEWQTTVGHGEQRSTQRYQSLNFLAINEALADNDPNTALNVFGDGPVNNPTTLAKLRTPIRQWAKTELTNINSTADGPLVDIAGRTIAAALGADWRREKLKHRVTVGSEPTVDPALSRNVYSAFLELFAPFIQPQDNITALYSITFSGAVRVDKYSDTGTTVNPKFGATYSPIPAVQLNATYGTSFRAPNLIELSSFNNFILLNTVPDPAAPGGGSRVLMLTGNNPDLENEKAKTWTFGITLEPAAMSGLSASLNYFRTRFKNRLDAPFDAFTLLIEENRYPTLVERNPSQERLSEICSSDRYFGDPLECTPANIAAILDARMQNMAESLVRGIDGSVTYAGKIGGIDFNLGASATYLIDYKYRHTETSPRFEAVDTLENPVDFRSRAFLSLSIDGVNGTAFLNYTDSYKDYRFSPKKKISSLTTVDLSAGVSLDKNLSLNPSGPINIYLSAINIFNTDPPFADLMYGYDSSNFDPTGRLLSIELRIAL